MPCRRRRACRGSCRLPCAQLEACWRRRRRWRHRSRPRRTAVGPAHRFCDVARCTSRESRPAEASSTGAQDVPRPSLRRRREPAAGRWRRFQRVGVRLNLAAGCQTHEDLAFPADHLVHSLLQALAAQSAAHVRIEAVTGAETDLIAVPRADNARAKGATILDISVQKRPTHVVAGRIDSVHIAAVGNESLRAPRCESKHTWCRDERGGETKEEARRQGRSHALHSHAAVCHAPG
jgi:hypothetical protein